MYSLFKMPNIIFSKTWFYTDDEEIDMGFFYTYSCLVYFVFVYKYQLFSASVLSIFNYSIKLLSVIKSYKYMFQLCASMSILPKYLLGFKNLV